MNSELQSKLKQLTDKVEEMRKVVFSNLVNWEQLISIAVGETFLVEGTINTKIYEDNSCMIFKTVIPAGVTFPYHLHNFLEQNLVIEGDLEDLTKKYKKTDWMIYEPFTGHEIKNNTNKDSSLIVIFTR